LDVFDWFEVRSILRHWSTLAYETDIAVSRGTVPLYSLLAEVVGVRPTVVAIAVTAEAGLARVLAGSSVAR